MSARSRSRGADRQPRLVRPKRVYASTLEQHFGNERGTVERQRRRKVIAGVAVMAAGGLVAFSHIGQMLGMLQLPFMPAKWHLIAYPVAGLIVLYGAVLAGQKR